MNPAARQTPSAFQRSGLGLVDVTGADASPLGFAIAFWRAVAHWMPTPDQVRERLLARRSYETVARELGISPGLAYMLATGVPADYSDDLHAGERVGRPELADSSQRLVNPHQYNPQRNPVVVEWIKRRAAAELTAADG
jgi:hypothetical protein